MEQNTILAHQTDHVLPYYKLYLYSLTYSCTSDCTTVAVDDTYKNMERYEPRSVSRDSATCIKTQYSHKY